ncbi:hypothetical protein N0V93_005988 [Gnomoniopsis smithogilvyi]|uniref:Uncharacterized protein n=1 Tax=Gnomoniopsis smithogilvyi TaxID=1191159 RepID=A0A9W8YR26_9PEZI|nr:hypothetical protein N0V93_005988 [Gnomoniopsis smithogilvyi]
MASQQQYHKLAKAPLADGDSTDDETLTSSSPRTPIFNTNSGKSVKVTVPLWAFALSNSLSLVLLVALSYQAFAPRPAPANAIITNPSTVVGSYDFEGYVCAPQEADPAVARARGCFYDTFTMQWYPRERYEVNESLELMNRFYDMGWPRFLDREKTQPVVDLETAPNIYYILAKEHLWHCGYTLIQTHLWITMGFDPPESFEHTEHCVQTLLDVIEANPPSDFMEIKSNTRSSLEPEEYQIVCILY